MTQRKVETADVERIIRDVLDTLGIEFSLLRVEPTPSGWRIRMKDVADRLLVTEIPVARPAQVREALVRWVEAST
jgi:hypothetical protein